MQDWNFKLLFNDENEFLKAINELNKELTELTKLEGKLNKKENFIKFLKGSTNLEIKLENIYIYASMQYDQNQKDVNALARYDKVLKLLNEINEKLSFQDAELSSLNKEDLFKYLEEEHLDSYKYMIDRLFLNKDHILDKKSEGIIASYDGVLRGYNHLYDKLAVADNYNKEVTLSDNTKITLTESNYRYFLQTLEKQEDRKLVFEAIFEYYYKHRQTFAGIYDGILSSLKVNKNIRGYNSILESQLGPKGIDKNVFLSLIETTLNNTDDVKRYYELRRKYFKLTKIHTYDRFKPFRISNKKYTYEEAKALFLETTKKVGGKFYENSVKVLEEGRIDVLPKDGKRTGAYSTGSYTNGPFILLNHNETLDSVFTLAHEAGHSMHTLFSNQNNPYETANYEIFVAEIASTFNEALLLDHLMSKDLDKDTKISLLEMQIDNILSTFYRQSLFATFEYEASKLVEANKAITYEALSAIMVDLYQKYYGIDIKEEKYKEYVWAYIPHFFHSPFYVYQYATSFAASQALYLKCKEEGEVAFKKYLGLLKAGGSDYPVNLVKQAGVDLTKKDAFLSVTKRLHELVVLIEELLQND